MDNKPENTPVEQSEALKITPNITENNPENLETKAPEPVTLVEEPVSEETLPKKESTAILENKVDTKPAQQNTAEPVTKETTQIAIDKVATPTADEESKIGKAVNEGFPEKVEELL